MALLDSTIDRLLLAASHATLARTEAEIQQQWLKVQSDFQTGWERKGRKVIHLIHDEYEDISDSDVVGFIGELNAIGKRQPVDLILHTRGGSALASEQIAAALVRRPKTAAFVPIFANSGGTQIALATQVVHLGRGAELGAFDLLYKGRPIRDLIRIAEELGDNAPPNLRLDAVEAARLLETETGKACSRINRSHKGIFGWRGCELARKLTGGEVSHSEGISFKQAKRLHVRVRGGVPKSVFMLLGVRMEQLARLRELQRTKIEQTAQEVSSESVAPGISGRHHEVTEPMRSAEPHRA